MSETCRDVVKRLFPEKDYEVRNVHTYFTSRVTGKQRETCLVDYKDRSVRADIDIEDECYQKCGYDEEDPEFEKCMDECEAELKETVDKAEVGSLYFDKETLKIIEATVPVNCRLVWGGREDPWSMELEDVEEALEDDTVKVMKRFDAIGCQMTSDWIHGHELAGNSEVETDPAMCYLHPRPRSDGKCRADAVLRVLRSI